MFKACLFDMDGVIVDSARYHFVAWQSLAHELGIDFTEADNEMLKGVSRVDSLEKILQKGDLQLDNDTKLALMEKKNQEYLEYIEKMTPEEILPGVERFLNELQDAGILIGLGSSSKNAEKILDAIHLKDYFKTIVDGNKITFAKPDPEVFLLGARAFNLDPSEVVVFEDALSGVEAANTGGFFSIGVGDAAVLTEANHVIPGFADFQLNDLQEIFNAK